MRQLLLFAVAIAILVGLAEVGSSVRAACIYLTFTDLDHYCQTFSNSVSYESCLVCRESPSGPLPGSMPTEEVTLVAFATPFCGGVTSASSSGRDRSSSEALLLAREQEQPSTSAFVRNWNLFCLVDPALFQLFRPPRPVLMN